MSVHLMLKHLNTVIVEHTPDPEKVRVILQELN